MIAFLQFIKAFVVASLTGLWRTIVYCTFCKDKQCKTNNYKKGGKANECHLPQDRDRS